MGIAVVPFTDSSIRDTSHFLRDPKPDGYFRSEEEGLLDGTNETTKEHEKQNNKFQELVQKSDKILFRIRAVFPFDLFPDEVIVDVNKVNIIQNSFLSKNMHSVFIKDISDVVVQTGILFACLSIIDFGFVENTIDIRYLDISKALEARRIIQGLVVSSRQGIDLSKVEVTDLRRKVEKLGEMKGVE